MELKNFKKYYTIPEEREVVFAALTKAHTIQLWTGEEAEFGEVGEEFSMFDGNICGKNLEIVAPSKIVQEWYFGDQEPPSIVTIKLHELPKGTSFELNHTNIPSVDFEDIVDGWNNLYIASLIDFFTE